MSKRTKSLTIADLEKAMGQKADKVDPYKFDLETGTFGRTITFNLKPKKKRISSTGRRDCA